MRQTATTKSLKLNSRMIDAMRSGLNGQTIVAKGITRKALWNRSLICQISGDRNYYLTQYGQQVLARIEAERAADPAPIACGDIVRLDNGRRHYTVTKSHSDYDNHHGIVTITSRREFAPAPGMEPKRTVMDVRISELVLIRKTAKTRKCCAS